MDARSRARLVVAHTALRLLRQRDFRSDVTETDGNGEHVIVPALPYDTMGEFFDQLRVARGTIYVAVLQGDEVALIAMATAHPPKHAAPSPDDCPIYRHTEVKMVLDYLRARRAPLRCYEALPNVMLELVDEGPALSSVGS